MEDPGQPRGDGRGFRYRGRQSDELTPSRVAEWGCQMVRAHSGPFEEHPPGRLGLAGPGGYRAAPLPCVAMCGIMLQLLEGSSPRHSSEDCGPRLDPLLAGFCWNGERCLRLPRACSTRRRYLSDSMDIPRSWADRGIARSEARTLQAPDHGGRGRGCEDVRARRGSAQALDPLHAGASGWTWETERKLLPP
jgi:hypothetical protein